MAIVGVDIVIVQNSAIHPASPHLSTEQALRRRLDEGTIPRQRVGAVHGVGHLLVIKWVIRCTLKENILSSLRLKAHPQLKT